MGLVYKNETYKGQTITTLDGSPAVFDAEGIARDVSEQAGLHLLPGYELLEGEPKMIVTPEMAVLPPNGPPVLCQGPSSMANQQGLIAPSGFSPVNFNADAIATVPDNCGMDQLPGYSYIDADGNPVEGHYEPAAPKSAEQLWPALSMEQRLEADWKRQQEATKPTSPPRQQEVDLPPPPSEVEKQRAAQAAVKDVEKDETSKGHAAHGKSEKHGHAIQQPKPKPQGSKPVASLAPAHAKVPAPAGKEAHASLYEAAQVAEEAE